MNDLRNYIDSIKEEVLAIYDGKATNEDGEQASFYDYFEDALDWNYSDLSYYEYCLVSAFFEKIGKRYGLLTDFRENGIC